MINNCSPEEVATLATSIAIAISKTCNKDDICLIKQLLSSICSLLSLMETQNFNNKKSEGKK